MIFRRADFAAAKVVLIHLVNRLKDEADGFKDHDLKTIRAKRIVFIT